MLLDFLVVVGYLLSIVMIWIGLDFCGSIFLWLGVVCDFNKEVVLIIFFDFGLVGIILLFLVNLILFSMLILNGNVFMGLILVELIGLILLKIVDVRNNNFEGLLFFFFFGVKFIYSGNFFLDGIVFGMVFGIVLLVLVFVGVLIFLLLSFFGGSSFRIFGVFVINLILFGDLKSNLFVLLLGGVFGGFGLIVVSIFFLLCCYWRKKKVYLVKFIYFDDFDLVLGKLVFYSNSSGSN